VVKEILNGFVKIKFCRIIFEVHKHIFERVQYTLRFIDSFYGIMFIIMVHYLLLLK